MHSIRILNNSLWVISIMSTKLKDDEMYCPECGAPIKKGFYTCANCRFKVKLSRQMNTETEDSSTQNTAGIVEEVKKPPPVPSESTAGKDLVEEIKEKEIDVGQAPVEKEREDVEAEPQIPYKPPGQDREAGTIEKKPGLEEKGKPDNEDKAIS